MKELFERGKRIEEIERGQRRPLGLVSDFVVEEWPSVLEKVRSNNQPVEEAIDLVTERMTGLTEMIRADELYQDEEVTNLARLDLIFLKWGIMQHGGVIPQNIEEAIMYLSFRVGRPPVLTYEDLVLTNPETDWRVFTKDEIGYAEKGFYETHKRIEEIMDPVMTVMLEVARRLKGREVDEGILEGMEIVADSMHEATAYVRQVGNKMRKAHFFMMTDDVGFRFYIKHHPAMGETMGPSGRFTAILPTMDILLAGKNLPVAVVEDLKLNDVYYPKKGREMMMEAWQVVGENESLVDLARTMGKPKPLVRAINRTILEVKKFRKAHKSAARKQVREAMDGLVEGTSGEVKVEEYLDQHRDIDYWMGRSSVG